jgi:hypothetical protein
MRNIRRAAAEKNRETRSDHRYNLSLTNVGLSEDFRKYLSDEQDTHYMDWPLPQMYANYKKGVFVRCVCT